MLRISFHSIRATLAECGWRARAVLSAPTSRTGVFIFRSTMSNSDAPSRHRRKPGNDGAELHSRDATSIRVFFHAFQESLPRTDGRRCLCSQRGRRSTERRTNSSCRAAMRGRSRGPISGTARLSARLKAKSDELRPQEPHPLRQSASPVDVPYDERDGRRYSNPQPRCQRLFDLCRQIVGLRGAIAAARKPGRVSLHCKDSQKRSCACQSRLSMLSRIFARLHVGVRIARQRFPLVPANAGTQSGLPRAREMSERSPDCAARNPELTARLAPDFVSLNPGYAEQDLALLHSSSVAEN